MNDQQRITALQDQLRRMEGLDERRFNRLMQELTRDGAHEGDATPEGLDDQGRLRIALFDAKPYDLESFDAHNQGRFAIQPIEASLGAATLDAARGCKVVCLFVNDRCDAEIVAGLADRGVELIALRCAGFNNVDLTACEQHGLDVVRVPAYSPYAVAEHTVALMLMLNRRLHLAYQRNRAGYFVLDGLTGFDMRGKTVGVVGAGKIGRCTIDILLGLGCRVLAYDPQPCDELAARAGVAYAELDRLFRESDIITLHLPLFPDTHHLIDAAAIARMKRGVMLINTSRGGLIDTRALIDGLKSEQVGYAGLDVYEEEAGIFFHNLSGKVLTDDVLARLMTFNNVVVTSHQAFLTHEALSNIAETTLSNIAEHQAGRRGAQLSNAVHGPS